MLDQPLFDKLTQLRLGGVKESLKEQMSSTKYNDLSFEERLGLLIDYEMVQREDRRLKRRIKSAKFKDPGRIVDLDMSVSRGISKKQILSLAQCFWIKEHLNIIITGATGVGKTYISSAIGNCACEKGYVVRYYKTSRLLHEIHSSHADGSWGKFLDKIAKIQLLILDDWFRDTLNANETRNILEVFDDRWQTGSLILVSQIPIENWHSRMKDPTLADAVLDRIIHNSHKLDLKGESQRKLKSNKNIQSETCIK